MPTLARHTLAPAFQSVHVYKVCPSGCGFTASGRQVGAVLEHLRVHQLYRECHGRIVARVTKVAA